MQQIQVLKLTGVITPAVTSNLYVGWIKELKGIVVQGENEDDTFDKLKSATKVMLEYRDNEARELLSEQLGISMENLIGVTLVSEVALA
jgi:predicted RNase H-like HicB family nuclease